MKKINWKGLALGGFALAALLYGFLGGPGRDDVNLAQTAGSIRPHGASTVSLIGDAAQGYSHALVESSYVNSSSPNGGWTKVSAPTGDWFDLIQIRNAAAGAAQAATLRFWASATDSTSILDKAMVIKLTSGGDVVQSYPVHCKCVTLTGVDNTDDFYVLGYVRDH